MRGSNKYLSGAVLSASLLFSGAAQAMPVPQFDKMTLNDKSSYESLLVIGAKNALIAHGQAAQANKLIALFKDSGANGGFSQLSRNMQKIRNLNGENATDPNNKQAPYEVEHAFYLTLKDNGITVPVSFLLTINKDFKPSAPSAKK